MENTFDENILEINSHTDEKLMRIVTTLNTAYSKVQAQLATLTKLVEALTKQTAEVNTA